MSGSGLVVRDLSVTYSGRATALHGVSLTVPDGGVVGVLGANGAGKTTVLRAISGISRAETAQVSGGTFSFDGESLVGLTPERVARHGIALVPERDKVFATLTVNENLGIVPRIGSRAEQRDRRAFVLDLFPNLGARLGQPAGLLSGGERQMLALGRALMLRPRLLLADELSFGIAPVLVTRMMQALRTIHAESGTSLLIVEQNAAALFGVADVVYVMETGSVVLEGPRDVVREHPRVKELSIGGEGEVGGRAG